MIKIKKIKIFFLLSIFYFLLPTASFAAVVFLSTDDSVVSMSKDFLVEVLVDTEKDSVNTIAGKLVFSTDFFDVKEIRDGNSQINFWVDKPKESGPGEISFSGITPGGLTGNNKFLLSIVFRPKKIGNTTIKFDNVEVFKNDGQGTRIDVKTTPLALSISTESGDQPSNILNIEDKDKPDDFKPVIGSDPDIFFAKYFLVFTAQDKGSGIDHYKVREGFWGKYIVAVSPYLLEDQSLTKTVYVKAIDKSGNERVVSISSQNTSPLYQLYIILGIILTVCIFIFKRK